MTQFLDVIMTHAHANSFLLSSYIRVLFPFFASKTPSHKEPDTDVPQKSVLYRRKGDVPHSFLLETCNLPKHHSVTMSSSKEGASPVKLVSVSLVICGMVADRRAY